MGLEAKKTIKSWVADVAPVPVPVSHDIIDAPTLLQGRSKEATSLTYRIYARNKARSFLRSLNEARAVYIVLDRKIEGDKGDIAKRQTRKYRREQAEKRSAKVVVAPVDVNRVPSYIGHPAESEIMPTGDEFNEWRRNQQWWAAFIDYMAAVIFDEAAQASTIFPDKRVVVDGHLGADAYESMIIGQQQQQRVRHEGEAPRISEADVACVYWAHWVAKHDEAKHVRILTMDTDLFAITLLLAEREKTGLFDPDRGGAALSLTLQHLDLAAKETVEVSTNMLYWRQWADDAFHSVYNLVFLLVFLGCDFNDKPGSKDAVTKVQNGLYGMSEEFVLERAQMYIETATLASPVNGREADVHVLLEIVNALWQEKKPKNKPARQVRLDEIHLSARRAAWTLHYWFWMWQCEDRVPHPLEVDDSGQSKWGFCEAGFLTHNDTSAGSTSDV